MKTKMILFCALFCFGAMSLNAQKLSDENDSGTETVEIAFTYLDSDASRRIEVPQMQGWVEVRFRGGMLGSVRAKFGSKRIGFVKVDETGSGFMHLYKSRGSEKHRIGFNENVDEGGDVPQEKLQGQHDVIMQIISDPNVIK
ncbi:MAG: hypothetical protein AAF598_09020 [Bacteroidota bacterium]